MSKESFEWDPDKDIENQLKHGISFTEAQLAFQDPNRLFYIDEKHSEVERRYFCLGKVKNKIMTVRFTYRGVVFRIIGAGYWRRGKKIYEEKNRVQ
ncbi:MAG: BrnT family toxin [Proteobacteria bacterium]|nr:BrnT family toxin [Pseudomonadota bacterium]